MPNTHPEVGSPPDDGEWYRQHAAELTRYATVLVGPHDAPDVVIDAVMTCFRSPGWAGVRNRRAYAYRAVLNRAMSDRRSAARREHREKVVSLRSRHVEPAVDADGLDAHRALAQLSAQQRAVIYLAYWEDLDSATIAHTLNVSDGTVRKQLARARDHLRRILDV